MISKVNDGVALSKPSFFFGLPQFPSFAISATAAMSHFNSNNTKNRSGLVQATSVTGQFNALSADRDNFQKAQTAARNKHEAIQGKISELKNHRTAFSTKNRAEQEVLGTHSRMREILLQKQARFNRVLENERKALDACTKHSHSLQDTINQATLQYAEDMTQVNEHVASTLHQEMREKQLSLLSVEAVEAVVLPRRPAHLHAAFAEAFQVLKNASNCLEQVQAQRASLTTQYDASDTARSAVGSTSHSMDLFYGLSHEGERSV
jgi:chromosome segregation ATPase